MDDDTIHVGRLKRVLCSELNVYKMTTKLVSDVATLSNVNRACCLLVWTIFVILCCYQSGVVAQIAGRLWQLPCEISN
jgi:hypothetical protein